MWSPVEVWTSNENHVSRILWHSKEVVQNWFAIKFLKIFNGLAKACKDNCVYEKNLPQQTKAVIGNQWSQVRDDDQASTLFNVDKAGVFSDTWMAQRKEEEPSVSVCEQCKLSGGRLVVGVRQSRSKATDKNMSCWWRGDCGQPYDWRKPNFMFTLQIATRRRGTWFSQHAQRQMESVTIKHAR